MSNVNDDRTFEIYDDVEMRPVRFKNRFGIELAGHLYLPAAGSNADNHGAAIAVSGPFGAVKEQVSGLYAQEFARMGFTAVAFDQSFCGESAGDVRNVASPDIFTEDFSAAVDFLGTVEGVDRERIGVQAICGLSGMALTAASSDTRIKAVATASMYDMSRSISRGYRDSYTEEQRREIMDFISAQRWRDVDAGSYGTGAHEIAIGPDGHIAPTPGGFPPELPEDANPVAKAFFQYYVKDAYHPRSVNSTNGWTQTTPFSFFNFSLMEHVDEISPRPVMLVAGENAHSLYYSQDVYEKLRDPRYLVVVPDADHVDLYWDKAKIPFGKLGEFFSSNLR